MVLPFKNLPANVRVPLFYAELDNSQANTAQLNQRTLIVGQMTAAGTGVANVPVISQGVSDAQLVGGANSMLALMTAAYRKNDTFGEVWYLPLADDGAAVAASGSLAFTAAATANGTLYVYIAGIRYILPVLTTQTTAQLATALAALINADLTCPVTASASTSTVTFTAVNKGVAGNDIDIRTNYLGSRGGEIQPAGLTYTITAMASGAVNPTLTTALGNCGSMLFDFIVFPYTDTTSLNAMQTFLNDSTGRWSWDLQLYGGYFSAIRGTLGSQQTFGAACNDQHGCVMGFYDSPSPSWIWAAALTGAVAPSLRNDPATPVQTLAIQGVLAPPIQSRYDLPSRNTLLYTGVSTFFVGDDGTVYVENLITTYQKNPFGNADNSYLEVETLYTLAYVLRALKTLVTSKYARVKLAADGTKFAQGSNIVTPSSIRADIIAKYRELEFAGLVQQSATFAKGVLVQQNALNPNRVDVLFPGILINQLRVFALLFQFRLS